MYVLLEAGADIKAKNKSQFTALHEAARRGNPDVVRALLEAGADIEAVNKFGRTALDLAKRYEEDAVVEVLENYKKN